MRNIQLFKTKKEYEAFVFGKIFKEKLIVEHPFYRNLIQFVVDSKAPIFYDQSDVSEHANFSNYYNFQLIRETYPNPTQETMFFLHDFTHMLFPYPYNVSAVSEHEFAEAIIAHEYAASNESEILLHYRVPEIRAKVFLDKRIFADILREQGIPQPMANNLFEVRKLIIETDVLDSFFFAKPEDQPAKEMLKSYYERNKVWCKERYPIVKAILQQHEYSYKFLTPQNYERAVVDYRKNDSQAEYERVVLQNIQLMFGVVGLEDPPKNFYECFDKVGLLEGMVMFKK